MQNDQIYSDITNLVVTRDDLNLINSKLDLLEAGIYETKGNTFDFVLQNSIPENFSNLISKAIISEDREEVLKKIKLNLAQIKFVEITLAIVPSQKLIEKISNYLNQSINQKIALDIKIDQSIIAGAVVIFEGKYHDGSVRSKLNKINYV